MQNLKNLQTSFKSGPKGVLGRRMNDKLGKTAVSSPTRSHTLTHASSHALIPEITNKSLCREGRKEAAAATAIFVDVGRCGFYWSNSEDGEREADSLGSAFARGKTQKRGRVCLTDNSEDAHSDSTQPLGQTTVSLHVESALSSWPLIYTTSGCDLQVCYCGPSRHCLCDVCTALIETGEDILHLSWEVKERERDREQRTNSGRERLQHTEMRFNLCTWLGETSSCSWLTVLPGPAWVPINKICKD